MTHSETFVDTDENIVIEIYRPTDHISTFTSGRGDDHVTVYATGFNNFHVHGNAGNDTITMSFDKVGDNDYTVGDGAAHGHHAFGDEYAGEHDLYHVQGRDSFNFTDFDHVTGIIYGRLGDFDFSRDQIMLNGQEIDIHNLPLNVKIVEHNGEYEDPNSHPQQWLMIETASGGAIFYTLEDARINMTYNGYLGEPHFLSNTIDYSTLTPVDFVDPKNFIPLFSPDHQGYEGYEDYLAGDGLAINDFDGSREDVLDVIEGTNDADLIAAGLNNDTVNAGGGNDYVWGGSGHDMVFAGVGNDKIEGGIGDDTLIGESGDDQLDGGTGRDSILGGDGDDTIDGGTGADIMNGGRGIDVYYVDNANDTITGERWWDDEISIAYSSVDYTIHAHVENIILTGTEDLDAWGSFIDNHITGNDGDNSLFGGGGSDTIVGGDGNDWILGGEDQDVFVFAHNHGYDRIRDYQDGIDQIDLSALGLSGFSELSFGSRNNGVWIETGAGKIDLFGINLNQIGQDDFIF